MELAIGGIISKLRHDKGTTQEQLANTIGVSIAAVSKWETGQAYPDIALLPSIAEYFTVSIDALMDFHIKDKYKSLEEIQVQLLDFYKTGDYNTALPIALDAVKKFPNEFTILRDLAGILSSRGTSGKSPDKEKDLRESISYHEAAAAIAPDENARVWMKKDISFAYAALGEYQKAINLLEKMNANRAYNTDIANLKFKMDQITEAKQMLQQDWLDIIFKIGVLFGRLSQCYLKEDNTPMAIDTLKLHTTVLEPMTGDKPNYCDLILSWIYQDTANLYRKTSQIDVMWDALRKASDHALRFDGEPSYNAVDIRFMESLTNTTLNNNSSDNACGSLIRVLEMKYADHSGDQRYIDMLAELKSAVSSKQDIGLWK